MERKAILAPDAGITKYYPNHLIEDRAWSDGNNVRFGVGHISKVDGWKAFLPAYDTWAMTKDYGEGACCIPSVTEVTMRAVTETIANEEVTYYVVTWTGHGLSAGSAVRFYTTGKLFNNVFAGRGYYVISAGLTANEFRFADGTGGEVVGVKDASQSGTLTASKNDHVYRCTAVGGGMSGLTEPVWPTTGDGTVADGSVTWQEVGVRALTGTLQAIDNYYLKDGTDHLMFITTKRIYRYDKDTYMFVDITGDSDLNGDDDHMVSTENAAERFIFTNGIDPIKYWGEKMDTIADLEGLNDCEPGPEGTAVTAVRAKYLLYWNNFLILGDTQESAATQFKHWPQRIRWSKLGDITIWKNDAEGNGEAGCADLSEGVDWVQAVRPLGNYLVVYKERSIHVLAYVGGDSIWEKRPVVTGTGLLASRAICDLGDEHILVGPDNIYSFDGIEPKIAGDDVAKEFFRILEPTKSLMTNSFFIEEVPEVWFSFVSIDSPDGYPDRAMVYNTDTKAWSWRDTPLLAYGYYNKNSDIEIEHMEFTIDSWDTPIDSSVDLLNSPVNICGDIGGIIYELGGTSFNGNEVVSTVTSKLFDFDQPGYIKRLLRIQFMISREGEGKVLPVYVGTADNVDEDVVWHGPYNMNLDKTYPPWIDMDLSSRYFCIRFGTVKKDEAFKLTGYIFSYELRGEI